MKSVIGVAALAYLCSSLLSGAVFLILDIKNNLSHGSIGLLHTLARLPIVLIAGPLYLCGLVYLRLDK
jgi:hypothetical protein